jgi:hypothetical protein
MKGFYKVGAWYLVNKETKKLKEKEAVQCIGAEPCMWQDGEGPGASFCTKCPGRSVWKTVDGTVYRLCRYANNKRLWKKISPVLVFLNLAVRRGEDKSPEQQSTANQAATIAQLIKQEVASYGKEE